MTIYDCHYYPVYHVSITGVEADTPEEAFAQAETEIDVELGQYPDLLPAGGTYAEEMGDGMVDVLDDKGNVAKSVNIAVPHTAPLLPDASLPKTTGGVSAYDLPDVPEDAAEMINESVADLIATLLITHEVHFSEALHWVRVSTEEMIEVPGPSKSMVDEEEV